MKRNFLLLLAAALLSFYPVSCSKSLEQTQEHWGQEEQKEEEKKQEETKPFNPSDYPPAYPDLAKGWTKSNIMDGIVYWEFRGQDPVSGDKQFVHVADINLSKGYNFIIGYDGEKHICSDMHRLKNAVVSINGGYETSSIFIKYQGSVKHNIENNKISGTEVTNWKNDGGICIDKNGAVSIANSMCSKEGETGVSQYGDALSAQRTFYRSSSAMTAMDNIISSGPLLIYEGHPWGETFVPKSMSAATYNSYVSENPFKHQGVRHPRTAIALCSDGRLLLIVADGRYSSVCNGFSARELTQFLVKNFNPVYALNMDGGGSSTMCVSGLGDEKTHVVNYPCDNGKADFDGERTVRTFFCVVRK